MEGTFLFYIKELRNLMMDWSIEGSLERWTLGKLIEERTEHECEPKV